MAGFKAPCPSCEHGVPVQDMKLVGSKIECPKCKYRFKVEAPKDMPAADAKGKDKGKDKGKSKSTDKSKKAKDEAGTPRKMDRKMMIGIGLGVVAVALLIGGGLMMFGGSSDSTPTPGSLPSQKPKAKVVQKIDAGNEDPTQKKNVDPAPKVAPPEIQLALSDKNATNLLPAGTQAVVYADFEKLRRTPLYNIVVTDSVSEVIRSVVGLEPEKIATYLQAYVDPARRPFGAVRLKDPIAEKEILDRLAVTKGPRSPLQGRAYHTLKPNGALDALGKLLTAEAILGRRSSAPNGEPENRPFAVCIYDTQTILLADQATLEAFLASLQPDGYPAFQTEFVKGDPMPKGPLPPAKTGDKDAKRGISANPDFCTIDPELKVLLNAIESEIPPILALAARLDARDRELDASRFSLSARPWALAASSALANAVMVSVAIRSLSEKDAAFQVILEAANGDEARAVKDRIVPMTTIAAGLMAPLLGHQLELEGFGEPTAAAPAVGTPEGGTGEAPKPPSTTSPAPADAGLTLGPSKLTLSLADRTITVTGSLQFTVQTYSNSVWPRMRLFGDQFRGQMLVMSGLAGRKLLAPAVSQISATGQFPRGTLDRQSGLERYGMPYPPSTRVSFFYDLLPYLGKGETAGSINPKLAWFHPQNLAGAEAWVPEFLVPEFPASSWRASSPYAEGRSLGATNVVGIAGRGRDAARFSPTDPAHAKQLGIVGYDWGSKMSEITDGAANTIYMMQVPPSYSRPWIAGGGATVMGVDDTLPNPISEFASPREGRHGTYAMMADGSVRWISSNIDKNVFLGLVTRAGGESLGDLDTIAPKDAGHVAELKTTGARK